MTIRKRRNQKLGSNPLDQLNWIGQNSSTSNNSNNTTKTNTIIKKEKRETFIIKIELSEKIKDYAYWERMKQKDALNFILEEFFKNKDLKKRPNE